MKIIIDIPQDFNFHIEVKNELTEFLDNYNITFPAKDSKYYELHKTYIHIDKLDLDELLNDSNNYHALAFRTPGATRGAIFIKEINHNVMSNGNKQIISIEYEILDIEFIEDTCFKILKTYSRDVVYAARRNLIGSTIILNINK